MTDGELSIFFETLGSLFPTKINDEQVKVWASRVRSMDMSEAGAALNDYYAKPKNPSDGPQPSLAGFLRCARGKREDDTAGKTSPEAAKVQRWTAEARERMANDLPHKRADIYTYSTERLWERFSAWEFAKLCRQLADTPMREVLASQASYRNPIAKHAQDARRVMYGQWKQWAAVCGDEIPDFDVAASMALDAQEVPA